MKSSQKKNSTAINSSAIKSEITPIKSAFNIIEIADEKEDAVINTKENSTNIIFIKNGISRNVKLYCGKNSKNKYVELNESLQDNKINRKITMDKNSEIDFYNIYAGAGNKESETTAELFENSSFRLKNILMAHKQIQNHSIKVIHKEKNSKSDLQCRGILSESTLTIKGLIKIEQKADESEGFQKSDMLILDDSQAISIPELEILNNNVKCSHGSSISRLDLEKIFYLQTRGISQEDAKQVMINAFLSSALIGLNEETERVVEIMEKKLMQITR
jgi:Fe-S cluster assembly protein SufD